MLQLRISAAAHPPRPSLRQMPETSPIKLEGTNCTTAYCDRPMRNAPSAGQNVGGSLPSPSHCCKHHRSQAFVLRQCVQTEAAAPRTWLVGSCNNEVKSIRTRDNTLVNRGVMPTSRNGPSNASASCISTGDAVTDHSILFAESMLQLLAREADQVLTWIKPTVFLNSSSNTTRALPTSQPRLTCR